MIRLEAAIFFAYVFFGAILLTWAGDRLWALLMRALKWCAHQVVASGDRATWRQNGLRND